MFRGFAEDVLLGGHGIMWCGERSASCLQDTLKTSMCANRLFPTARLSCKQLADPSLKGQLPKSCAIHIITTCLPVQKVPGVCSQGTRPLPQAHQDSMRMTQPSVGKRRRLAVFRTINCREQLISAHGRLERVLKAANRLRLMARRFWLCAFPDIQSALPMAAGPEERAQAVLSNAATCQ